MSEFFKRHYRGLMLAFLVGVLLPPALSGNLSASVADSNHFEGLETVDEVVIQYHLLANDLTNAYLLTLTDESYQEANATAYVGDEECSNKNVTTYCLAVAMNELLVDFELKLRSMENELDLEPEEGETMNTLESGIGKALADRNKIDREIQAARDSLDLTLAVYNQVQSVYPLHKELADLISNLEGYRDNLASIRGQMELYPSRFNNATSPTCK